MIIEKIKPKSYDVKTSKRPKNFFFKKSEDSKLQKYWNKTIYIYIYNYAIRNTIERRESMIIAFLLLKLARQLNVLQKMNLKIHM